MDSMTKELMGQYPQTPPSIIFGLEPPLLTSSLFPTADCSMIYGYIYHGYIYGITVCLLIRFICGLLVPLRGHLQILYFSFYVSH